MHIPYLHQQLILNWQWRGLRYSLLVCFINTCFTVTTGIFSFSSMSASSMKKKSETKKHTWTVYPMHIFFKLIKGHTLLGCPYAMDKGMLNIKQNLKHILKNII